MYFTTTISYAIGAGGRRVRASAPGLSDRVLYVCEGCGGGLLLTTLDGVRQFVHSLHNNVAIVKAATCPRMPRERRRTPRQATVTQRWYCIPCRTRWYGPRICPYCEDDQCAIPAHGDY